MNHPKRSAPIMELVCDKCGDSTDPEDDSSGDMLGSPGDPCLNCNRGVLHFASHDSSHDYFVTSSNRKLMRPGTIGICDLHKMAHCGYCDEDRLPGDHLNEEDEAHDGYSRVGDDFDESYGNPTVPKSPSIGVEDNFRGPDMRSHHDFESNKTSLLGSKPNSDVYNDFYSGGTCTGCNRDLSWGEDPSGSGICNECHDRYLKENGSSPKQASSRRIMADTSIDYDIACPNCGSESISDSTDGATELHECRDCDFVWDTDDLDPDFLVGEENNFNMTPETERVSSKINEPLELKCTNCGDKSTEKGEYTYTGMLCPNCQQGILEFMVTSSKVAAEFDTDSSMDEGDYDLDSAGYDDLSADATPDYSNTDQMYPALGPEGDMVNAPQSNQSQGESSQNNDLITNAFKRANHTARFWSFEAAEDDSQEDEDDNFLVDHNPGIVEPTIEINIGEDPMGEPTKVGSILSGYHNHTDTLMKHVNNNHGGIIPKVDHDEIIKESDEEPDNFPHVGRVVLPKVTGSEKCFDCGLPLDDRGTDQDDQGHSFHTTCPDDRNEGWKKNIVEDNEEVDRQHREGLTVEEFAKKHGLEDQLNRFAHGLVDHQQDLRGHLYENHGWDPSDDESDPTYGPSNYLKKHVNDHLSTSLQPYQEEVGMVNPHEHDEMKNAYKVGLTSINDGMPNTAVEKDSLQPPVDNIPTGSTENVTNVVQKNVKGLDKNGDGLYPRSSRDPLKDNNKDDIARALMSPLPKKLVDEQEWTNEEALSNGGGHRTRDPKKASDNDDTYSECDDVPRINNLDEMEDHMNTHHGIPNPWEQVGKEADWDPYPARGKPLKEWDRPHDDDVLDYYKDWHKGESRTSSKIAGGGLVQGPICSNCEGTRHTIEKVPGSETEAIATCKGCGNTQKATRVPASTVFKSPLEDDNNYWEDKFKNSKKAASTADSSHKFNGDEDRCSCGAEEVYWEPYNGEKGGYGCEGEGPWANRKRRLYGPSGKKNQNSLSYYD